MKTLAELSAIRDRMKNKVALREESGETRIVVVGKMPECEWF